MDGTRLRSILHPFAAVLFACAAAPAQDDLRDRLTLRDGKLVHGRVQVPAAPDELVLLQGGKRVRVPRAEVAAADLVGERIREFGARRVRMKDSPKAQAYLVDWAHRHELPGLARAQAMLLALDDDGHEAAHEFLGHKRTGKSWTWDLDGRSVARDQLEAALARKPFEIAGERFVLRCDAGLRAGVAALLDLEYMAAVFFARFGEPLQLREVLEPIRVATWRSADPFPKWGFRPLPYYQPPPHGDEARTFYAGVAPGRPQRLFFVGTEALLYRTLIGEVDRADDRDRICAWLEVGLGMLMENTMDGPPGYAAPGPLRAQDLQALQALGRTLRITQLIHLPMYSGFYLMDDTPTTIHWAAATMFVAWLLDPDNVPATREPFLRFVVAALRERQGDSSSAFDKAMGRRIEELEEPWTKWLAKQAGY